MYSLLGFSPLSSIPQLNVWLCRIFCPGLVCGNGGGPPIRLPPGVPTCWELGHCTPVATGIRLSLASFSWAPVLSSTAVTHHPRLPRWSVDLRAQTLSSSPWRAIAGDLVTGWSASEAAALGTWPFLAPCICVFTKPDKLPILDTVHLSGTNRKFCGSFLPVHFDSNQTNI